MTDLSLEPVERLLMLAAKGDRTAARELQRRDICPPYCGSLEGVVAVGGEIAADPTRTTRLVTTRRTWTAR